MKDLGDIIEACRTNEDATEEELRYAVLAQSALMTFDRGDLQKLVEKEGKPSLFFTPTKMFEERHSRMHRALNKSPKEWLGWDYDFKNPDYVERMKRIAKIFKSKEV